MSHDSVDPAVVTAEVAPTASTEAPLQWGPRLGRPPMKWGPVQVALLVVMFAIGLIVVPLAIYLSIPTVHIGDFFHLEGGSLSDIYEFGK